MTTDAQAPIDLAKIETSVSEACTRSGAFALLLAVVLFLLSAYWLQEKRDEAAAQYTALRTNLAMYLDVLDDDKIWQAFKQSHPDAENMTMSQLLNSKAEIVESTGTAAAKQNTAPTTPPPPQKVLHTKSNNLVGSRLKPPTALAPAPPTALSASFVLILDLYEMKSIQDHFRKLNDAEMLMQARNASNFYEFSIVRWVLKRGVMAYGNAVTGTCHVSALELPRKSMRVRYTPQLDDRALFDCLTLSNVRELGKFELPEITNPAPIGRRVAQDVDFSPGSLPRDPYLATVVTQLLLFLVLTYFTAFAQEAVAFESFPARGTVFGVFSRSRWTLAVFFGALWAPTAGTCAILITSKKLLLALGIIPIALVSIRMYRILQSRFFFEPLDPSVFFNACLQFWRRTRKPNKTSERNAGSSGGANE